MSAPRWGKPRARSTSSPGSEEVTSPDRAGRPDGTGRTRRTRRLFGRHPVGLVLASPYILFLIAVFAYPLGFAVWMSFHDYFFAAPGAVVDRPFVGFANYLSVFGDPAVRRAF